MTPNQPSSRHSRVGGNPAKKNVPRSGQKSGLRIRNSVLGIAPRCAQRGFSLVSAIFLLVVIAVLGVFAVTMFTAQQQSAALDLLGSRGYQAARAGIEWGAYHAINSGSCSSSSTVALAATGLQDFTVTVTCSSTAASESGVTITLYQLTSTATRGTLTSPDYVERQITASIVR